jgi:hypothetical protein
MRYRSSTTQFSSWMAFTLGLPLVAISISVSPAAARDPAVSEEQALEPESDNLSGDSPEKQEVNVRYADVYRKIAELNLQMAVESDRRVPNTIPLAELDRLRQVVRLAEAQCKAAKAGEKEDLTLEQDASQVKVAQDALQKAVAANNQTPGTVPQIVVDRLRLLAELSRLQLAKDKLASKPKPPPVAELQQRVETLEQEVRELRKQLERFASATAADRPKSRGK